MKGTFFQKPFEFNLRVDGERWNQGDRITGTLIVRNHSPEKLPLDGVAVRLADGELKKVRQKANNAFEIISAVSAEQGGCVQPNEAIEIPWSFSTDENCSITDTLMSPFLLYGKGDETDKLGQIQLPFEPAAVIQEFLKIIEINFRFVRKTQKSSKGWVEVKLAPPSAKAFMMLDLLVLGFHFEGKAFAVNYGFRVKKIEGPSGAAQVKTEKKQVEQRFEEHQYLTQSGRINFEQFETAIKEALSAVESKIVF